MHWVRVRTPHAALAAVLVAQVLARCLATSPVKLWGGQPLDVRAQARAPGPPQQAPRAPTQPPPAPPSSRPGQAEGGTQGGWVSASRAPGHATQAHPDSHWQAGGGPSALSAPTPQAAPEGDGALLLLPGSRWWWGASGLPQGGAASLQALVSPLLVDARGSHLGLGSGEGGGGWAGASQGAGGAGAGQPAVLGGGGGAASADDARVGLIRSARPAARQDESQRWGTLRAAITKVSARCPDGLPEQAGL